MIIASRFAGKCRACGGPIQVGNRVEWVKGVKGTRHEVCPTVLDGNLVQPTPANGSPSNAPTDKQLAMVAGLAGERGVAEVEAFLDADPTRKQVSQLIEHLLTLPKLGGVAKSPPADPLPDVAAGRYAVFTGEPMRDDVAGVPGGGGLAFYRVSRPTIGQWAGRTFLRQLTLPSRGWVRVGQWSPAFRPVLEAIAADADALFRYGKYIGDCGICGKVLTDDLSKQLGIGPVCRKNRGLGSGVIKPIPFVDPNQLTMEDVA